MLPSKLADIEPPFSAERIKTAPWGCAGEQPVKQHNSTGGRSHGSVWWRSCTPIHSPPIDTKYLIEWDLFGIKHWQNHSQTLPDSENGVQWPRIRSQYLLLILIIPYKTNGAFPLSTCKMKCYSVHLFFRRRNFLKGKKVIYRTNP